MHVAQQHRAQRTHTDSVSALLFTKRDCFNFPWEKKIAQTRFCSCFPVIKSDTKHHFVTVGVPQIATWPRDVKIVDNGGLHCTCARARQSANHALPALCTLVSLSALFFLFTTRAKKQVTVQFCCSESC